MSDTDDLILKFIPRKYGEIIEDRFKMIMTKSVSPYEAVTSLDDDYEKLLNLFCLH